MTNARGDENFEGWWRRLQHFGLNAYEARSYLVLVGHPQFKALELASRAHVPRQKIYEVLDSLVEKGFAQVIQEKTKIFSAVEPSLAIPSYLARRSQAVQQDLEDQTRAAQGLVDELAASYMEGRGGRGTLDYLSIVSQPGQTAAQYRHMLAEVRSEYLEFSRPPYAVDPLEEQLVRQARARGVFCRLLIESGTLDHQHRQRLDEYAAAGVDIRQAHSLPMKLALFDGERGLLALLDPVVTKSTWTAVVFEHSGMGEAMKGLFETYWHKSGNR